MSAVQQRLAAFLAGFDRDAIAGAVVRRAGQSPDEARLMVDTYLGEMSVGLATVEPPQGAELGQGDEAPAGDHEHRGEEDAEHPHSQGKVVPKNHRDRCLRAGDVQA